ncbi:unnamed protein product [Sphenostylis stenocarpa]|uniref:Uncharacterized protein n=1 Tax=Sphenostylis stenocarpa TaxID=92480 RepID=A0AA86SIH5_9FABA|nr:unnamed protein product [Sphenostylis stenocarpa]
METDTRSGYCVVRLMDHITIKVDLLPCAGERKVSMNSFPLIPILQPSPQTFHRLKRIFSIASQGLTLRSRCDSLLSSCCFSSWICSSILNFVFDLLDLNFN